MLESRYVVLARYQTGMICMFHVTGIMIHEVDRPVSVEEEQVH